MRQRVVVMFSVMAVLALATIAKETFSSGRCVKTHLPFHRDDYSYGTYI